MSTGAEGLPVRFGGRYLREDILGRGGMARVYRARDERLGREVALKVLDPVVAGRPDGPARMAREARSLAGLDDPRIVRVLDMGEEDGLPFLVMELVEGVSLDQRLLSGPLPPDLAAEVAAEVAGALSVAHAGGIVHRDVKPQNLMLTPGGGVKVLDFGVARPLEGGAVLTAGGIALGTLGYLAPEVIGGSGPTRAADVYALGVTLHHALTGVAPAPGGPDRSLPLPTALEPIVVDLLAPDPDARPSAAEAERRLRAVAAEPETAPTAVAGPPGSSSGRRRALLAGGAVAAAAAGAVIAVVLVTSNGGDASRAPAAPTTLAAAASPARTGPAAATVTVTTGATAPAPPPAPADLPGTLVALEALAGRGALGPAGPRVAASAGRLRDTLAAGGDPGKDAAKLRRLLERALAGNAALDPGARALALSALGRLAALEATRGKGKGKGKGKR
jgi:eukaryotic-like serine/threonine-protein kinase